MKGQKRTAMPAYIKPQLEEGSTLHDAIKARGIATVSAQKAGRKGACYEIGSFVLAYAIVVRNTIISWGAEVPEHETDAKLICWACNTTAVGPIRVQQLTRLCRTLSDQLGKEGAPFHQWTFWARGQELSFETPEHISSCKDCGRLFFHTDVRRHTCKHCLRKAERNKKRAQRGTDLSERDCEVCGTAFTPKRSHAKVCSPKCRAKLSRQRNKADPEPD